MAINETIDATADSHLLDSIDENNAEIKAKPSLFKKTRLPLQENFNVSFQESNFEYTGQSTVLESPDTFRKQRRDLFVNGKMSPTPVPFKSFHNDPSPHTVEETSDETTVTPQSDSSSTLLHKPNPFTGPKLEQTENFSIDFEHGKTNVSDLTGTTSNSVLFKTTSATSNSYIFQLPAFSQTPTPDPNSPKSSQEVSPHANKTHPFKTPPEPSIRDPFQMHFEDSTTASTLEKHSQANILFMQTIQNEGTFNVSYDTTKTICQNNLPEPTAQDNTGSSPSDQIHTQNNILNNGDIGDPQNKETEEIIRQEVTGGMVIINSVTNQNLSLNRSRHQSKSPSSQSILDHSSFNDHNLKCWMSDNSDEEIVLCNVPAVPSTNKEAAVMYPVRKGSEEQATLPLSWVEKFSRLMKKAEKDGEAREVGEKRSSKGGQKRAKRDAGGNGRAEAKGQLEGNPSRPQKRVKPRGFTSEMLYPHLIEKLKPTFGIRSKIEAERLVLSISEAVKKVRRRNEYQKKIIASLKKELALAGVVETTVDFYQFVRQFLPYDFRVKVIPSVQPVTNIIYPPRDTANPFDRIL